MSVVVKVLRVGGVLGRSCGVERKLSGDSDAVRKLLKGDRDMVTGKRD